MTEGQPRKISPDRARPTGRLVVALDRFNAPLEARTSIARRAGPLSGTLLPVSRIENIIEQSMEHNSGLPNWDRVQEDVASVVSGIYRKFRRVK
ncbi:MAG: hypothetical protein A2868_04080 [Candidatus Levybacteria bacterium RIFCSPHIGHO2_01_FULL_40_15b]|nr:MAG: hypothetical protein A2868_04080 [Candidatus Levybacteria bacterium RIFCSPHIGHO2_01_FULL_40_15b]